MLVGGSHIVLVLSVFILLSNYNYIHVCSVGRIKEKVHTQQYSLELQSDTDLRIYICVILI